MGLVPVENSGSMYVDNCNLTYNADFENDKILGMCDRLDAVIQSVYKILSTQRYNFVIYDRNYGIELCDLIGKGYVYVSAVIKGRICEALLYDERIKEVCDFEITRNTDSVTVSFKVVTIYGESSVSKKFTI